MYLRVWPGITDGNGATVRANFEYVSEDPWLKPQNLNRHGPRHPKPRHWYLAEALCRKQSGG